MRPQIESALAVVPAADLSRAFPAFWAPAPALSVTPRAILTPAFLLRCAGRGEGQREGERESESESEGGRDRD